MALAIAIGTSAVVVAFTDAGFTIRFVPDAEALPALWLASGAELDTSLEASPINSWDRTLLEFVCYRAVLTGWSNRANNLRTLLAPRDTGSDGISEFATIPLFESMSLLNRAYLSYLDKDSSKARKLLEEVLVRSPNHPIAVKASRTIR